MKISSKPSNTPVYKANIRQKLTTPRPIYRTHSSSHRTNLRIKAKPSNTDQQFTVTRPIHWIYSPSHQADILIKDIRGKITKHSISKRFGGKLLSYEIDHCIQEAKIFKTESAWRLSAQCRGLQITPSRNPPWYI